MKKEGELTSQEKRKKYGLLNCLKREFLDAKSKTGKSLSEVKNHCETTSQILALLEKKISIVPDYSTEDIYRIPDFEVPELYKKPFVDLVFDLSARGILENKESLNPGPRIIVTSRPVHEIISGKNIIIKDKKGLRQYAKQIQKLLTDIEKLETPTEDFVEGGSSDHRCTTTVDEEIGYLFLRDQRIPIGESSSGKFKLIEMLCNRGFGKSQTIENVFNNTKPVKDKNKPDGALSNSYMSGTRKLALLENQLREINRAITSHVKKERLRSFKYRLTLKADNRTHPRHVWLEQKVGRRG